jgi:subtilisin family serine protease
VEEDDGVNENIIVQRRDGSSQKLIVPKSERVIESDAAASARAELGQQDARELPLLPSKVENRYIVRLRDDTADVRGKADRLASQHAASRRHVFGNTIKGFTLVNLSDRELESLRQDPDVVSVEKDVKMRANYVNQANPDWALDRIDQASGLNMSFVSYFHGTGTHVYIVDSGVRGDHQEFTGRIGNGVNTYDSTAPTYDEGGHGTMVASAAAGKTLGVAREATIHPVKITDDDWAWASDMVAGIDWVTANAKYPAVLNLSYDGSMDMIADALTRAVQKRITVVKAAGNEHEDACTDESNQASGVIVAAASDRNDQRSAFSDYGPCVSLFAPGVGVRVADWITPYAYATVNGTSFSAPYTAGVAAAMLGQDPTLTPYMVAMYLGSSAWAGRIQDWQANTPNLLLNSHHQAASISGKSEINSGTTYDGVPTTHTWTAKTLGGSTAWTYKWERSLNGTTSYTTIGTSKSVSLTVQPGSKYTMSLRLTASSLGRTVVVYRPVKVLPEDYCPSQKVCNLNDDL